MTGPAAAFDLADNEGLQFGWTSDAAIAKELKAPVPGLMLLRESAEGTALKVPRNKDEFTSEFITNWFDSQTAGN